MIFLQKTFDDNLWIVCRSEASAPDWSMTPFCGILSLESPFVMEDFGPAIHLAPCPVLTGRWFSVKSEDAAEAILSITERYAEKFAHLVITVSSFRTEPKSAGNPQHGFRRVSLDLSGRAFFRKAGGLRL